MNIEKEISKILEEQLPAKMFETVKDKIESIGLLEKKADGLKKELEEKQKRVISLTVRLNEKNEQVSAMADLEHEKREHAENLSQFEERERNLAIHDLRIQLAASEDKVAFVKEVALGLVRNTSFRKTVYEDKVDILPPPMKDDYGNTHPSSVQVTPTTKNETVKPE